MNPKPKLDTTMTKTRTYNLRGAIRLTPDADPYPVAGTLPDGHCDVLGTLTVGPSLPGALALYPFPATDYDDTAYPYTLVYVRDAQWHRLPMRKTVKAILDHGYQIRPRPWKLDQGDMGYEFVKIGD